MLIVFLVVLVIAIFVIWCSKTSHTPEERKNINTALKEQNKRNSDYIKAMWGKSD